ncbi:MAG: T9SS type A sorting domain-containing protein [Candidatus Hatepunaea meridiana]|nr:T9SS type A sorting domain-containing protein [Candidatus Hatepunaea meridiana]
MLQGLRKSLLIVAIALFTPLVTVYGNDLQENLEYVGRYNFYPDYTKVLMVDDTLFYTDYTMLGALDMSDPEHPEFIGETLYPGRAKFLSRSNDYVYLCSHGIGFCIYDLQCPITSMMSGLAEQPDGFTYLNSVAFGNNYALIVGSMNRHVCSLELGEPDEMPIVFQYDSDHSISEVISSGDIFYARISRGIEIIDGSGERGNPVDVLYPEVGFSSIVISDDHLFGIFCHPVPRFLITDLANPFEPREIAFSHLPDLPENNNLRFICPPFNNIALLRTSSNRPRSIFAIDFSDPEEPFISADLSELHPILTEGQLDMDTGLLTCAQESVIRVWDLNDPTEPEQVTVYGDEEAEQIQYRSILIHNDLVFLGCRDELLIFDISRLDQPDLISTFIPEEGELGSMIGISDEEHLLVSCQNDDRAQDILVVNIDNPERPEVLGTLPIEHNFDEMVLDGNTFYTLLNRNEMGIFDISDPFHPQQLTTFNLNDRVEIIDIKNLDETLIVANDYGEIVSIDISDYDNVTALDSIELGSAIRMTVVDDVIIVGNRVIDCSNPEQLRIIASLDGVFDAAGAIERDSEGNLLYNKGYYKYKSEVFDFTDPQHPRRIAWQWALALGNSSYGGIIAVSDGRIVNVTKDALTTHTIPTGIDVEPIIEPDMVNFGEVFVGDSVVVSITVINRSRIPLELFYLRSDYPAVYSQDDLVEVDPQSELEYNLIFKPDEAGEIDGIVLIRYAWGWIPVRIRGEGRSVNSVDTAEELPLKFNINGMYPNPFNSTSVLSYSLSRASDVKLTIYDLSGRIESCMDIGCVEVGEHRLNIEASALPSGVYIASLQAAGEVMMVKMVIVK